MSSTTSPGGVSAAQFIAKWSRSELYERATRQERSHDYAAIKVMWTGKRRATRTE